jgi:hypothetical protein
MYGWNQVLTLDFTAMQDTVEVRFKRRTSDQAAQFDVLDDGDESKIEKE